MNTAIPERRPATEERVTFHNDENGFCVLRVKAPWHREGTTIVGSLPSVTAGEWLVAEGWWMRDKEHGLQFKATIMKTVPPTTVERAVPRQRLGQADRANSREEAGAARPD
jgi:exodeoxyribonuclease V alpha subunit